MPTFEDQYLCKIMPIELYIYQFVWWVMIGWVLDFLHYLFNVK